MTDTASPGGGPAKGGTFRSLRIRNYRLYFTGNIISQTGTWMNRVAQDWLVLQLTDNSPVALGVATALQFGPTLALSLLAGTVADRSDKRKLLIAIQIVLGTVGVTLGLLASVHVATIWHVYVACLVVGIAATFDGPVRQAFVMEIVGPRDVTNAVAMNSMGFNGARIVGPAVAGVLIAVFDSGPVMVIAGLSYTAVVVGLLLMRPGELRPARRVARAKGQVRDGLRYVRKRGDLVIVLVLVFLVATFAMNYQLTLAIMARIVFHRDASSYGLLTSTLAVGSLLGALLSARRRAVPRLRFLMITAIVFGLLECSLGFIGSYALLAVMLVPAGMLMLVFSNAANALIQLTTDAVMRGRVMGLYTLAFLGGTPFIAPVLGWFADRFGGGAPLVVGGAGAALSGIVLGVVVARRNDIHLQYRQHPVPHLHVANPSTDDHEHLSQTVADSAHAVSETVTQTAQVVADTAGRIVAPAVSGVRRVL
jgi:MFS family permease